MSVWGGFTDEELKRLNNGLTSGNQVRNQPKEVSFKRQSYRKIQKPIQINNQVTQDIPPQLKLSLPSKALESDKDKNPNSNEHKSEDVEHKISSTGTGVQSSKKCSDEEKFACNSMNTSETNNVEDAKFLTDETTILEKGLQNLERFREHQKEVEELNKKRKAMLAMAILEKEKRANAETKKLVQIKKELEQLDLLVVSDISIIRDKIEEASRSYLTAQKRYELAEKEFIEAKTDLHKKHECKEQLTEHLYTVIHQNEMRKASKLHELMSKLEMEEKEAVEDGCVPTIPPMVILEQPHLPKPKFLGSKTLQSSESPSVEAGVENSVPCEDEVKNPNSVENSAENSTV